MERKDVIERAYQLINEPIDPNQRCPVELEDIVDYKEADAGETIEYFKSDVTTPGDGLNERAADTILTYTDHGIVYVKVPLKSVTPLVFVGLQSNLETVLIDEILNSKDQTALAQKKDAIGRAMDCEEVRRILALCLAVASQEVSGATTGKDILDTIIDMKQKISNYATDYILLVASDVMDAIEKYDKEMAKTGGNIYRIGIMETIAAIGIKKVVKVLGNSGLDAGNTPVLGAGKAILIGRNSNLVKGRPITFLRRKFTKEVAENSGAAEGAVRLVDVAKNPIIINANGHNTLGYGVFGYESLIQVLTNYRAVAWSDDILLGV